MPLVSSAPARRLDSPARPCSSWRTPHPARLRGIARRPAAWYAGFAVYAACVALFSGPGLDHWWGTWAVGGYALAAVVAAVARNTIAYPLGLTAANSPAQSPLPGHFLVAMFGPPGHATAIALLALTGVVFAVFLVTTPPTTPGGAAVRIALGLATMFALCPATRFGYLIYPLALFAWATLTAGPGIARRATARYAASVAWEPWRSRPESSAGPMRA